MRTAGAVLAALLILAAAASDAATPARVCRRVCGSAVAGCMADGGSRGACRRRLVRRCRRESTAVCETTRSVTTTTYPPYVYTTTGYPSPLPVLDVGGARTAFELGSVVPPSGAEFVLVDVTVSNAGSLPFTPSGFVLYAGGLGFRQAYTSPSEPFPSCDGLVVVQPQGSLACTLAFAVPEGLSGGRIALEQYYYAPATAWSEEFDIPSLPRPTAALDVTAVSILPVLACSVRPGFVDMRVSFALASVNGASGLDLDPSAFLLDAGDAVYGVDWCSSYNLPDPCVQAVGVPVDGAASCTLVFQVPDGLDEGSLRFFDGRYAAEDGFTIP